jgi:ATP-dependent DNA helicase RecQ
MKGSTYLETYESLQQGHTIEAIAEQRNLHIITIQSHVAALLERGYAIDYQAYIQPVEVDIIRAALNKLGVQSAKAIYEYFEEKYDYFKIKLAMALYKREAKRLEKE